MVTSARRVDERVSATVEPIELERDDPLIGCDGTAKALELETDLLGRIQISKFESGVDHTAYALLADLIEVDRRCGREEETHE